MPHSSQSLSAKDMVMQMVATRMNQDGTEQDISHVFVARVAGDVATDLAQASARISETNARSLETLSKLGYDKDSQLVIDQLFVSNEMNKVLVSIGQAVAGRVR
jgi:hypothetical protein